MPAKARAIEVEATQQENVSEQLLTVANKGPALLTNRFVVTVGPFGVRIAFMEQTVGGEDTAEFRTAVVMAHQDGIRLYKLLQRLLEKVEVALSEARAEKDNA